jgi:flagellar basal-body rod protein FlgC
MGLLNAIGVTASGIAAQRIRMDIVSSNVANMNSTRASDGGPYRRQITEISEGTAAFTIPRSARDLLGRPTTGVRIRTSEDNVTPMRRVYDPSHPDADEDGFFEMPNVDLVTEMTDLTSASRSYSANVTVLNALKDMALRALDIGSR